MSPYEYSIRDADGVPGHMGAIDLTTGPTFAAGYDPNYLVKNGIDFEYFAQAGIFTEPNKDQAK